MLNVLHDFEERIQESEQSWQIGAWRVRLLACKAGWQASKAALPGKEVEISQGASGVGCLSHPWLGPHTGGAPVTSRSFPEIPAEHPQ